jgi:hypothetical protein
MMSATFSPLLVRSIGNASQIRVTMMPINDPMAKHANGTSWSLIAVSVWTNKKPAACDASHRGETLQAAGLQFWDRTGRV